MQIIENKTLVTTERNTFFAVILVGWIEDSNCLRANTVRYIITILCFTISRFQILFKMILPNTRAMNRKNCRP